jgi:peptidoglycan biosynthesis protein MviN/MurJ (putative lipid II flippase)
VVGLALGHATSYMFSSAVCLILLRRRLRGIEAASIVATLSRVLPAGALSALAAFGVAELLEHTLGVATLPLQIVQVGPPFSPAACLRGLGIYLRHPGGR